MTGPVAEPGPLAPGAICLASVSFFSGCSESRVARSRCWFPQPFLWFMSKEKFLPRHVRLSISILVPSVCLSLFIYICLFLYLKLVGVEFLLPQLPENHCQNVLKYVYHLEEIPSADSRLHCLPLDPLPLPPAPFPPHNYTAPPICIWELPP